MAGGHGLLAALSDEATFAGWPGPRQGRSRAGAGVALEQFAWPRTRCLALGRRLGARIEDRCAMSNGARPVPPADRRGAVEWLVMVATRDAKDGCASKDPEAEEE